MSTIALFVALGTGTSYAASRLAPNTVNSQAIINNSVQGADLSPALRKQLAGGSTAPTAAKPAAGGWSPTGLSFAGNAWHCYNDACAHQPAVDNTAGFQKLDIGSQYTRMRISGTLTPAAGMTAPTNLDFYVEAQATPGGPTRSLANCKAYRTADGDPAGVAGQAYTVKCDLNNFAYTTATNSYVRIRMSVSTPAGTAAASVDGNIKVEVQKA